MRYAEQHKAQSRERIIQAAAGQFRLQGAETVRVSDVMKLAGMTVGGFYKHFETKEGLLQEAVSAALSSVAEALVSQVAGMPRNEALRAVILHYLSDEHVLRPDLGCALAALGTELARLPAPMNLEISKALSAYAERLNFLMPGKTHAARRQAFLVLFPSMAGCVMTARAHTSAALKTEVLAGARTFFIASFCK